MDKPLIALQTFEIYKIMSSYLMKQSGNKSHFYCMMIIYVNEQSGSLINIVGTALSAL